MSKEELRAHIIETVNRLEDEGQLESISEYVDRVAKVDFEDPAFVDFLLEKARKGRAQIEAGNFITGEQLQERMKARIAEIEKRKGTYGA